MGASRTILNQYSETAMDKARVFQNNEAMEALRSVAESSQGSKEKYDLLYAASQGDVEFISNQLKEGKLSVEDKLCEGTGDRLVPLVFVCQVVRGCCHLRDVRITVF